MSAVDLDTVDLDMISLDTVDLSVTSLGVSSLHELKNEIRLTLPASREDLTSLKAGDDILLSGYIYTMRDIGHVRTLNYLKDYGELPYGLDGQALFYAGPTEPKPNNAKQPFASIGPTTASRMDFATPTLLRAGITVMLGKGSRSRDVKLACRQTGSVYLVATGGAAALLAAHVVKSELIAWDDLGTEALRRLVLHELPCFCGLDVHGGDIYE